MNRQPKERQTANNRLEHYAGSAALHRRGSGGALGRMTMRDLTSDTFNDAVERIFAFLLDHGFSIPSGGRTDTALTAGVQFIGKNAAIALGLDRRDQSIDCYVGAVKDGKAHPWSQTQGYWGHFHGFLVRHRGYRGTFREFATQDHSEPEYIRTLKMYAAALKSLGKDIVEDRPDVFMTEKK